VKVRFGDCLFDAEARTVWRGAARIHLSPKAFEVLTVLIERRGRALSKAELFERVWPDVFVSEASLARVVTEIREALGDSPKGAQIVRTVHRYGYAFAALVVDDPSRFSAADGERPVCWLTGRTRTYCLGEGEHLVWREPDATISLDSPKVSRRHARILVSDGRATIEDLTSKNGTFVSGVRLSTPTILEAGDTIQIGPFALTFRVSQKLAATETESEQTRHSRFHT